MDYGLGREFPEFFEDGGEVRKFFGIVAGFRVLDDAFLINNEGRAFGDAAHGESDLGEKGVVGDLVESGDGVFVIAEERDFDAFFGGPGLLRKGVVSTDAKDAGIEIFVLGEALGHIAKFGGANPGEGHGEEEQKNGALGNFRRKIDLGESVRSFGCKGEVRRGGSDR